MGIYLELSEVNTNLSGILGPIVLGSAAAGYIAAVSAAAQGSIGGMVGLLGRVGDIVGNHTSSVALASAAAVIVLIARAGHRAPRNTAGRGGAGGRRAPVTATVPPPISREAPPIRPDRTRSPSAPRRSLRPPSIRPRPRARRQARRWPQHASGRLPSPEREPEAEIARHRPTARPRLRRRPGADRRDRHSGRHQRTGLGRFRGARSGRGTPQRPGSADDQTGRGRPTVDPR